MRSILYLMHLNDDEEVNTENNFYIIFILKWQWYEVTEAKPYKLEKGKKW